MTMEELLEHLGGNFDRVTLEEYITHAWVRPAGKRFEDIDVARARLVHQLRHDMKIGDDAMDIVLHLLDQLYGMHERMRILKHAIRRQPRSVQAELWEFLIEETGDEVTDA